MSMLATALAQVADHAAPASLETFRSHIDPEWIERALTVTGTATLRRRRLPAEQVVWVVMGMALCRNRPIHEVISKLDLALPEARGAIPVARSAISKARQRVGSEPLRWLFEHSAEQWEIQTLGRTIVGAGYHFSPSTARRSESRTPTRIESTMAS